MTINLPLYNEALRDPAKARILFDASKGGNVRGITEDHRYELANVMQRATTLAEANKQAEDALDAILAALWPNCELGWNAWARHANEII